MAIAFGGSVESCNGTSMHRQSTCSSLPKQSVCKLSSVIFCRDQMTSEKPSTGDYTATLGLVLRRVFLHLSPHLVFSISCSMRQLITVLDRLIASTILKATYGYSVLSGDDPIVNLLERAATMSGEAGSPGGTSIDLFPFRMFFP